jgi:diacylglycerol kinase (ATP)
MVKEAPHHTDRRIQMKGNSFSAKARCKSIGHALRGIRKFFIQEPNALIHLAGSIGVVAVAFYLKVSMIEFSILILSIGFVWVAELFNTAIEEIMNFVSPEYHPKTKLIKDIAAGAVLVAALGSLITGAIIFGSKIL